MESDVWEEDDAAGTRQYLQATAIRLGTRNLLALRALPLERFTYQQLSHQFQMAQEEAERQKAIAERATRAKSDFLATMSHEIRTPLNAIIGMADVLRGSPLTADQENCVEIFQRNGVHLLNLINDILDLAKVESGKVELETVRLDLREVIARAVEVIEGRARAKGLPVETYISPDVPRFYTGDPNRLRQILINLLGNAIKFTESGHLAVQVEQDPEDSSPGSLRFAVADTGIGIPDDKVSQVFESFSQADTSTTRKYGGTGLGLTISRQFIELMRGRIWVESKLGQGSTFLFTVKLTPEADQSEPIPETASLVPVALERRVDGLRILLVDDSRDNRFLISSYLKDAYCSIEIAEDGQQAVERFRTGQYDVVLMDVEMPVMDGYTATREIRQHEERMGIAPTPVVALTAHAFAEMKDQWQHAGFSAYLTKPIRKATLIEALASSATLGIAMDLESEPPVGQFSQGAPRVLVESGMEDVVPGYLDRRRKELAIYRDALNAADFETIRVLGHKMRGTGGGYGLPLLTELGRLIEDAALQNDAAEVASSVDRLATYLGTVELDYAGGTPKSPSGGATNEPN
jgi:signal transduction histidine kinase/CheY-like chemotaxis protein/HPt (histidine-containing phosphotransfer) domain-containing protein